MGFTRYKRGFWVYGHGLHIGFVFIGLFFVFSIQGSAQNEEKTSAFGEYSGYSQETYDSWVRSSRYITVRDGTKLAVDLIRPAIKKEPEDRALPVLWTHHRYRRAYYQSGKLYSLALAPYIQALVKRGYIVAAVDVRGSGASFGSWKGPFTKEETQDAFEITEWLAAQPWCDGNIGMLGASYLGTTQLMAASTAPPSLKAIFPGASLFDLYHVAYPGGIYHDDFFKTWSQLTNIIDTRAIAVAVDGDKDEALLKKAVGEHKSNRSLHKIFSALPYRNSHDKATGAKPYHDWSPARFIKEINQSGISVYLFTGWYDLFSRDGFLWFANLEVPKKIAVGPWPHVPKDPVLQINQLRFYTIEMIRWFDYWLKGIENGIMDEPSIHYFVMGAPEDKAWRSAEKWPLSESKATYYYLHKGPSGSVNSGNDGILSAEYPSEGFGKDSCGVDYTATSGQATRWDNTVGGDFNYRDMTLNDTKGLTYTTLPLISDVEITGHPVIHLWAGSTAKDGDFFVYLEEVDAKGVSHYISEGCLRASYGALHDPPYDSLGLPFHRSFDEDLKELTPGIPAAFVVELQPTSNLFDADHRIRITITFADKDNALTEKLSPSPTVTVYRNTSHPSHISLPLIPALSEQVSKDK